MQLLSGVIEKRLAQATRPHDALVVPVVDLLLRAVVTWLLVVGLLAFATWSGHAVVQAGGWAAADAGLFRALNGLALGPLAAFFVVALNEPAPNYFALIVLILGYCWWRQRLMLPVAALAIALALALGLSATREMHHAGGGARPRPFLTVSEARTPITQCGSNTLATWRTEEGPEASCDDADAAVAGFDWRTIWVEFATFPSGHMRETVALCLLLVYFWPASWPFVLGYSLLMALSRINLGAHYPSDVLAGTVVGLWSVGATLWGLALLRQLLRYLHRIPTVGRGWDWIVGTRVAGRPDLDPLPARLIRVAAYVVAVNVGLLALGYATTNSGASQIHSALQSADVWAFGQFTSRFDPASAAPLYLLFGRAGLIYALLVGAALAYTWLRRRAAFVPLLAALAVAVLFALELSVLGQALFYREPPFRQEAIALPPLWRDAWAIGGSFPNQHALLVAALAGVLAGTWRRAALPAQLLAAAGVLTALYFGVTWITDALVGLLLGNMAALAAWYGVSQFVAPREPDERLEQVNRQQPAPRNRPANGRRATAGRDR